jgi:hypothetical protein
MEWRYESLGYIRSNTVSFQRENKADANVLAGMTIVQNSLSRDNSFSKPVNDIDLLFSSDYVIGELDPEFESIPYDGD